MKQNELIWRDRNSRMNLNEVYFWTNTIKDWNKLLVKDKSKQLIIDSLRYLVDKNKIIVYAFVIMPNHIHILWRITKMNGNEMPHASFNKFTSHKMIKDLEVHHLKVLPYFKVDQKEREYRVWQRDPLAVLMDSRKKLEQKIDYIHENPMSERWNLVERPEDYYWSSAKFYEYGIDDFGILTHYMEEF